jgi:hypothetical protein
MTGIDMVRIGRRRRRVTVEPLEKPARRREEPPAPRREEPAPKEPARREKTPA